jgi:hypothetical protein
MTFSVVNGPTIAAGQSLSDGANCAAGAMIRITVPQEFVGDSLSFQVSTDGQFYNDLYDTNGNEITIKANPDTGIVLQDNWVKQIPYVKFRSGTRETPIEQKEDVRFAIAINT